MMSALGLKRAIGVLTLATVCISLFVMDTSKSYAQISLEDVEDNSFSFEFSDDFWAALIANLPAESFGDFFYNDRVMLSGANVDIPLAGGSRRVKISENNMALPLDRILFTYNHFHNAMDIEDLVVPSDSRSESLNRYTFGFEKTFWEGNASIEIRMPFTDGFEFTSAGGDPSIAGGDVGDLALITKFLLYVDQNFSWVTGLGINLPTGSDVVGIEAASPFRIENEAVHLLPYTGVMLMPDDRRFFHAFAQVDVPTNGHTVTGTGLFPTDERIREHTLLYLDVSAGYWLYRDPSRASEPGIGLTGLAALLEVHYTTSLQTPDSAAPFFEFGHVDIVNLTAGIHADLGSNLAVRFAGVVPIEQSPGQFDSELQGSVIWRF